jgi:hypothetical protein
MPVACLFCCSASSAFASSAVERELKFKNAVLEIFKRLAIPIEKFDTLEDNDLLKLCAKCFKCIVLVRSYLNEIDKYKLLIHSQVEAVVNCVKDGTKKGGRVAAASKRGVAWDNFRRPIIQST